MILLLLMTVDARTGMAVERHATGRSPTGRSSSRFAGSRRPSGSPASRRLAQGARHPSVPAHRVPRAAGAARCLLRRPPGRVLRDRRPQRLRQEHAAEDHGEHLPRRSRPDPRWPGGWPPSSSSASASTPSSPSRENVVLNGVMMGLGPARGGGAARRGPRLRRAREFADLKLKNYSSGMMVRLAFAVMVEADADIMLVDEVLAVGDAAFAQKCMDVFHARRRAGKTLVLVTHDMATVESLCDRAMLIDDGEVRYLGDPGGDGDALLPRQLRRHRTQRPHRRAERRLGRERAAHRRLAGGPGRRARDGRRGARSDPRPDRA